MWALWGSTQQCPCQLPDTAGLGAFGLCWRALPQHLLYLQLPSAPSSGVLSNVVTVIHVIAAETLQCYECAIYCFLVSTNNLSNILEIVCHLSSCIVWFILTSALVCPLLCNSQLVNPEFTAETQSFPVITLDLVAFLLF